MRKKFEYKSFETALSVHDLNELGNDGWELVSHTAISSSLKPMSQYYVFKREILISDYKELSQV